MILPACPFKLKAVLWPDVYFHEKQREIIQSVEDNDWTVVPAAHQVGKDYVAGFIVLAYFLRFRPCRIVTTSVKAENLDILWGEMGRYISSSKIPLDHRKGGPLLINHLHIRRVMNDKTVCDISYIKGAVAKDGAAMAGHHAEYTLFVADEASGVPDETTERVDSWAKKGLLIGNPYECQNLFRRLVDAGDVLK